MAKMQWQAVVAGVGGQGVIFVTRLLAQGLMPKSGQVLISEVHGMAQRGGSVVSHLKAGGFASPLVSQGQAQLLISLEAGEAVRNLAFVAPGGWLVVNAPGRQVFSDEAWSALEAHGVRALLVDASGLALGAGYPKGANVVLSAAAAAAGALPLSAGEMQELLNQASSGSRAQANQKLFALGAAAAAPASGGQA